MSDLRRVPRLDPVIPRFHAVVDIRSLKDIQAHIAHAGGNELAVKGAGAGARADLQYLAAIDLAHHGLKGLENLMGWSFRPGLPVGRLDEES